MLYFKDKPRVRQLSKMSLKALLICVQLIEKDFQSTACSIIEAQ